MSGYTVFFDDGGIHSLRRLSEAVLAESDADTWEEALLEWDVGDAEYLEGEDEFAHCPCGIRIKNLHWIENRESGAEMYVGSVCIDKFSNMNAIGISDGLKKLKNNINCNTNKAFISYARDRGFINDEDADILVKLLGKNKRSITMVERVNRQAMHKRILKKTVVTNRRRRSLKS